MDGSRIFTYNLPSPSSSSRITSATPHQSTRDTTYFSVSFHYYSRKHSYYLDTVAAQCSDVEEVLAALLGVRVVAVQVHAVADGADVGAGDDVYLVTMFSIFVCEADL